MIAIGKRYRTKSTYNWQNSHTIIIIIIIFHKNTKYFWLSFNSIVSITCCANLKSLKSSLCLDINSDFMGIFVGGPRAPIRARESYYVSRIQFIRGRSFFRLAVSMVQAGTQSKISSGPDKNTPGDSVPSGKSKTIIRSC